MASDATPRCASMASADRQMIGDATLGPRPRRRSGAGLAPVWRCCARPGHARAAGRRPQVGAP
ncbi:hypothetical protein D8B31_12890 [Verminephrobacter eiseniae]|nr:hypothetical protein [Verminephrobacter eiseniae]MCW8224193.1 hypothetical protein [Verminephrobacter eiseniae]